MVGLMLALAPAPPIALASSAPPSARPAKRPTCSPSSCATAARDIIEAGRELGRFDSRPWLGSLPGPIAMVLTTRDELVSPRKQRELAHASRAQVFETALGHMDVGRAESGYGATLLEALAALGSGEDVKAA